MHDPCEHLMVFQALTNGTAGCVRWKSVPLKWVTEQGWDPRDVVREVAEFLRIHGREALRQKIEERDSLGDPQDNFYDVVFPYGGLKNGLYLEVVLKIPDGDMSVASIVSVHEQRDRAGGRKGWR